MIFHWATVPTGMPPKLCWQADRPGTASPAASFPKRVWPSYAPLRRNAELFPDRIATVAGEARTSWGSTLDRVARLGAAFRILEIGRASCRERVRQSV